VESFWKQAEQFTTSLPGHRSCNQTSRTIQKFDPNGTASLFASGLSSPTGLAFDSLGNLYVANQGNNTIDRFTSAGVRSLFANTGLNVPVGLAFDPAGNLYALNHADNLLALTAA
jgi:DNA-binding beta-propeller fold protein YncE